MKHLLTIIAALSLIATGCQKDPIATAIVGPNPAYVGDVITFESRSTNTSYVEWEMGDGFSYSEPYVEHYYVDPGGYDAKLNDGTFFIAIVGDISILTYLMKIPALMKGKKINHPKVHYFHSKSISLENVSDTPCYLEMDGEPGFSCPVAFTCLHSGVKFLEIVTVVGSIRLAKRALVEKSAL